MPPAAGDPPHQKTSVRRIPIPANLVGSTLAQIDNLAELKLALRVAALLAAQPTRRGIPPSLGLVELLDDAVLRQSSATETDGIATPDAAIHTALADNLRRATLSAIRKDGDIRIFINDQDCQQYLAKSGLQPLPPESVDIKAAAVHPLGYQPTRRPAGRVANIFALYERHIGAIGHNVGEQLVAAEEEYPAAWIEAAFDLAAEHNAHSWQYVVAILRRWLQEGRPAETIASRNRQRDQHHEHGKPGRDSAPDSRTGYLESYQRRYGRLPWEPAAPTGGTGG